MQRASLDMHIQGMAAVLHAGYKSVSPKLQSAGAITCPVAGKLSDVGHCKIWLEWQALLEPVHSRTHVSLPCLQQVRCHLTRRHIPDRRRDRQQNASGLSQLPQSCSSTPCYTASHPR